MKVENPPTHHHGENNVSGATQSHFMPSLRPPAINLAKKDTATLLWGQYSAVYYYPVKFKIIPLKMK